MDLNNLPDDVGKLKQIIVDLVDDFQSQIEELNKKLRLFQQAIYGRRSEKRPPTPPPFVQPLPFFDTTPPAEPEPPVKETHVPAHTRRVPRRRPAPKELPVVEVVHDIPEHAKLCSCSHPLTEIRREVSEQIEIVPGRIVVIRHVRPLYACKACEGIEAEHPVKIAPPPPQILPKSIAGPGLLADILVAKFVDHIPFYRKAQQFARLGISISRASMSEWAIKVATACMAIYNLMVSALLDAPIIGADETPLQVLDEPGRAPTSRSYIWVFYTGVPGAWKVVVYHYAPSRSKEVARQFLDGYQGYVQTDGYAGYDFLDSIEGVTHVGCWAHARRKFYEVIKARPANLQVPKQGTADHALECIGALYAIEREAKQKALPPEAVKDLRQEKAVPILHRLHAWLQERQPEVPPRSLLGKAIGYTLDQWPRLTRYTEDGRLAIDNNRVENSIRPFALGRKNWLFAGSAKGAESSAILYTIIHTAKANAHEPTAYLRYLFHFLPRATRLEDLEALLPWRLSPETAQRFEPWPELARIPEHAPG
ncbi:MAG: IS66 family transposase [Caldilineae bacterium]|nr:MAG: IS66 family transposase [Caldilineae bacterium]